MCFMCKRSSTRADESETFGRGFRSSTKRVTLNLKYSHVERVSRSACQTAILHLKMLWSAINIIRSNGVPSSLSTGRCRTPEGSKGNFFLMVRRSDRNTASQQSRKTCSIVSYFLYIMQCVPHGTNMPFSASQGSTASVPICSWKKNVFIPAGTIAFFRPI